MEKPCDNTDNGKSGKQGALLTALLSLFGLIAALLIALIVIVGISAFRSEPPVADNEIYAELADKYKYNAVELYDGVANVYASAFVYTATIMSAATTCRPCARVSTAEIRMKRQGSSSLSDTIPITTSLF